MSKKVLWVVVALCLCVTAIAATLTILHSRNSLSADGQNALTNAPLSYDNYTNVRFAYLLCYPLQVLVPQGESADGDGQKFISKNGQATAIVYGANNALGQTLEQVFAQDSHDVNGTPIVITSKNLGPDKFNFTGTAGAMTVIEETFLQDQIIKTLNIQFPTAAAGTYNPIAARMTACFANTTAPSYSN